MAFSRVGEMFHWVNWRSSAPATNAPETREKEEKEEKTEEKKESAQAEVKFASNSDKASYSLGFDAGKKLTSSFHGSDIDLLTRGFSDAVRNHNPALKIEEIQAIVSAVMGGLQTAQDDVMKQLLAKNQTEGVAFLERNRSAKGINVFKNGVQYKILTTGDGAVPQPLDTVTIHFRGTFLNGTAFVDTFGNAPKTTKVQGSLPGWTEALTHMKVGGKWKIFVPPHLCYGDKGQPQLGVEPGATLIFDIELLAIQK